MLYNLLQHSRPQLLSLTIEYQDHSLSEKISSRIRHWNEADNPSHRMIHDYTIVPFVRDTFRMETILDFSLRHLG